MMLQVLKPAFFNSRCALRTVPKVFIRSSSPTVCFSRSIRGPLNQHLKLSAYGNNLLLVNNRGWLGSFSSPTPVSCACQSRSRNNSSHSEQTQNNSAKYLEVYLIHNIRFFRLLCRFSRYSFLAFMFGSPLCIASSYLNIIPMETLRIIFLCLSFYMIIFTGQSFIFSSRIVAKIMMKPESDVVKISHLTLFGNRRDMYVKSSDIVKSPHFGAELMSKNMVMLKFNKPSKKLIFLPGHGGIDTNYQALEFLFCSDSVKGD